MNQLRPIVTIYSRPISIVPHSRAVYTKTTISKHRTDANTIKYSESVIDKHRKTPSRLVMSGPMCGGLSAVKEKDDHVNGVVDEAKRLVAEKTGLKVASIDVHSYRSQMVSGTNFFVKAILKTEEGLEKIAHLRIYQSLQSNLELTAVQLDKSLDDKIEYFQ